MTWTSRRRESQTVYWCQRTAVADADDGDPAIRVRAVSRRPSDQT